MEYQAIQMPAVAPYRHDPVDDVEKVNKTVSEDKTAGLEAETARLLAAAFKQEIEVATSNRGNHALQDYQMQLMLLEQQNKKRLRQARLEQKQDRLDGKPPITLPPQWKSSPVGSLNGAGKVTTPNQLLKHGYANVQQGTVQTVAPPGFVQSARPATFEKKTSRQDVASQRWRQNDAMRAMDNGVNGTRMPAAQRDVEEHAKRLGLLLKRQSDVMSARRKSKLPIRSTSQSNRTKPSQSTVLPTMTAAMQEPLLDQTENANNLYTTPDSLFEQSIRKTADMTRLSPGGPHKFDAGPSTSVGSEYDLPQGDEATMSGPSSHTYTPLTTQSVGHMSLSSHLVSPGVLKEYGIRFLQDPINTSNVIVLDEITAEKLASLLHITSTHSTAESLIQVPVDEGTNFPVSETKEPGRHLSTSEATHGKARQVEIREAGRANSQVRTSDDEVENSLGALNIPGRGHEHLYCTPSRSDIHGKAVSYTWHAPKEDTNKKVFLTCEDGQSQQASHGGFHSPEYQRSESPISCGSVQQDNECSPETTQSQSLQLLKDLLQQNARLRAELDTASSESKDASTPWAVAYRVYCPLVGSHATYLDIPVWVWDQESRHQHLDARRRISNENSWEEKQENVPFVAYLEYNCSDHPDNVSAKRLHAGCQRRNDRGRGARDDSDTIAHRGEEVFIRSLELREALARQMITNEGLITYLQAWFLDTGRLRAPYLMYYHFKDALCQIPEGVSDACATEYRILMDYFDVRTAKESEIADQMIANGKITREYIPYLFVPGQVLLRPSKHGLEAVKQKSKIVPEIPLDEEEEDYEPDNVSGWNLDIEVISFDGEFHAKIEKVNLSFASDEAMMDISDLKVYPLAPTNQSIREKLVDRGRLFWECRKGRYMASESAMDKTNQDVRYMVDAKTYKLVHKTYPIFNVEEPHLPTLERPYPGQGGRDEDDFFLRLPSSIAAFNMREKKWHTVAVDSLRNVSWNTDAFNTLAVDQKTKTLLEALVTNKIEADRGTDVVAGKGTGLIVLLHGGPGTGKTLTAESVAEFVKKPLYRITCGDVGTHPKEVEEYLESAFQLGRTWDCVVLLDEADVFLEQRSFHNLERNALVSVFLRVLEYYDGILLLTSNRVGTFDEAFKSRIQLALHYDNLDEEQRAQIWSNFINRLEYLEVEMDFVGIRKKLATLASRDLNGRQIRNIITTARQLAKHEKKQVKYEHLVHVMEVSSKFEDYLLEVKDHVTDAEMQREEGIR